MRVNDIGLLTEHQPNEFCERPDVAQCMNAGSELIHFRHAEPTGGRKVLEARLARRYAAIHKQSVEPTEFETLIEQYDVSRRTANIQPRDDAQNLHPAVGFMVHVGFIP